MQLVDIAAGDATCDAFVVPAETRDDGTVTLDLTIATGAREHGFARLSRAPRGR